MKCLFYEKCNHIDCDKDFCIKKYKLSCLYEKARLGDKLKNSVDLYLDKAPANNDATAFTRLKEIETNIIEFVTAGKNLYLFSGQCGNGKTTWAVKLLKAYLNRIWAKSSDECKALYINVPRFMQQVKDSFSIQSEEVTYLKENIIKADLVVFDEISAKIGSEFDIDFLLSIIDTRLSSNKTNIYTSNADKSKLINQLGERLHSRVYNNSECIEFKGTDKRNYNRQNGDAQK